MTEIDVNEVFDTDSDQSVDFEILFASVMASTLIVISGVSPLLDKISIFAALGLLLFTMVRRMAIDNPYAAEHKIMTLSMMFIYAITAFGIIYTSIYLTTFLQGWINIGYLSSTTLFLFTLPYAVLISYELIYRDFFLWASIVTYNKTGGESFGHKIIEMALSASSIDQKEIPNPLADIVSEETPSIQFWQKAKITLAIILFVGLLYGIGWFLAFFITDLAFVQALLILLSSLPLMGMLEFWYSRHGNSKHSDLTKFHLRVLYFLIVVLTVYHGQM